LPNSFFSLLTDLVVNGGALATLDGPSNTGPTTGEGGEEVPVRPDSFLTIFLGLNLPDTNVGGVKPALAFGVGSTTPIFGIGVGVPPGVGVSGESTEMESIAALEGRCDCGAAAILSASINCNSAGDLDNKGEDDGGVMSDASTNSSSSSDPSVSEDNPPSSWRALTLN
jgi:hypothetical protein